MQRQLRLVVHVHLHGLRGGEGAASSEEEGRGLLLQRREEGGAGVAGAGCREGRGWEGGRRREERERGGGPRGHAVQSMQCWQAQLPVHQKRQWRLRHPCSPCSPTAASGPHHITHTEKGKRGHQPTHIAHFLQTHSQLLHGQ